MAFNTNSVSLILPSKMAYLRENIGIYLKPLDLSFFQANLPYIFCAGALSTTCYLINKLPTPKLNNQSPYQLLYQKPPQYHHLKIFGCLYFSWLKLYAQHKLSTRSTNCIVIGYAPYQKGYICFDPITKQTYSSRYVIFCEGMFPYQQTPTLITSQSPVIPATNQPPLTF